jgi:protein-arginine kinase
LPQNQSTVLDLTSIADSILKNDSFYQKALLSKQNYWIIKKDVYRVLGPFSKSEYIKMKSNLQIDEALKLKSE